jgi:hypothetical protein
MGLKWRDPAWYDGSVEIPTRRRIGAGALARRHNQRS